MPLVVCSLCAWFARADGASSQAVGVVDTFLNARAVRDVNAIATVFDKDAQIVDGNRDLATGLEGLYQLLPLGDTIEVGPRTQAEDGEVSWTETVLQAARPSWENNLNWWTDGNDAVGALVSTPGTGEVPLASRAQTSAGGLAATNDTRYMQAVVTQAGITRLTVTDGAPHEASMSASSGVAESVPIPALIATVALLECTVVGIVASEPPARPACGDGGLVQGLKGWLEVRQRRGPLDPRTSTDSPNPRVAAQFALQRPRGGPGPKSVALQEWPR
jgi:hypothetical protein